MATTNHAPVIAEIRSIAAEHGLRVSAADGMVTVGGSVTPGDEDAYRAKIGEAHRILSLCPRSSAGSTWGNDGIGYEIGLRYGSVSIKKSGVNKPFTRMLGR